MIMVTIELKKPSEELPKNEQCECLVYFQYGCFRVYVWEPNHQAWRDPDSQTADPYFMEPNEVLYWDYMPEHPVDYTL